MPAVVPLSTPDSAPTISFAHSPFSLGFTLMCHYSVCATFLDTSTNLKRGNMGSANMHKKYSRQDRDPAWLSHIPAR